MAVSRKILVVSHFGAVGELCKRMMCEGNQVKFHIKDPHSKDINDGLIKKVPAWEPHVDWADLIIFDDTNFGKIIEGLRADGKAVVGGCIYTDKLEMDRGFGQEEMRKAGMTILPDWTFKNMDEAIRFIQKNPGRYVLKPNGVASDEKVLTYVGKSEDGSDAVAMLENYKKRWAGKIHDIQIQTFAKGVEVAIGGFFNGKDFEGWDGPVGEYEVRDGAIVCQPGKGGTIYTKEEYSDFVARLEFKLPPGGNNGLAIRYPGQGDTAYAGLCEIQVLDDTAAMYNTLDPRQYCGSIYGVVAAHRGYLRPVGQWNYEEVTVKGSTIKVELNGTVIVNADVNKVTEYMHNSQHPGKTRTVGHFGFAGHNDPVAFRNIQIKPL